MKRFLVPVMLMTFMFFGIQGASANTHNDGNTKPQPENSQKEVAPNKYKFTLFSFFTNTETVKPDSSSTSFENKNSAARKEN